MPCMTRIRSMDLLSFLDSGIAGFPIINKSYARMGIIFHPAAWYPSGHNLYVPFDHDLSQNFCFKIRRICFWHTKKPHGR